MTREEKIKFIVESVLALEGEEIFPTYFEGWTDVQIDLEVEWMEYLWTK